MLHDPKSFYICRSGLPFGDDPDFYYDEIAYILHFCNIFVNNLMKKFFRNLSSAHKNPAFRRLFVPSGGSSVD